MRPERNSDGVIVGGGLQLEIERYAKALTQSEA